MGEKRIEKEEELKHNVMHNGRKGSGSKKGSGKGTSSEEDGIAMPMINETYFIINEKGENVTAIRQVEATIRETYTFTNKQRQTQTMFRMVKAISEEYTFIDPKTGRKQTAFRKVKAKDLSKPIKDRRGRVKGYESIPLTEYEQAYIEESYSYIDEETGRNVTMSRKVMAVEERYSFRNKKTGRQETKVRLVKALDKRKPIRNKQGRITSYQPILLTNYTEVIDENSAYYDEDYYDDFEEVEEIELEPLVHDIMIITRNKLNHIHVKYTIPRKTIVCRFDYECNNKKIRKMDPFCQHVGFVVSNWSKKIEGSSFPKHFFFALDADTIRNIPSVNTGSSRSATAQMMAAVTHTQCPTLSVGIYGLVKGLDKPRPK